MLHDDFITQLLNMEDSLVKADNIETDLTEKVKYVHISTKPVPAFCEKCGSRMHSKGHDIRKPVHKECLKVEFLVSDMFNAYISYAGKYFPNAVSVVDSFHVVQMINSKLKAYMILKEKEFKTRDKEREQVLQLEKGNPGGL